MKALVTGSSGFIGSSLAVRLINEGWAVTGLDRRPAPDRLEAKTGFTGRAGDLVEVDLVTELALEYDAIFHLAGRAGVRSSWGGAFSDYVSDNVIATQRLLDAAVETQTSARILYASSSSIYGAASVSMTPEDTLPRPASPYGVTKLAGEHLVAAYQAANRVNALSLRLFTVYGPGQRAEMAFAQFLAAARDGTEATVYGDGGQVRDFTYIDDVVDAFVLAAHTPSAQSVLNICGGNQSSVTDVLEMVGRISGSPVRVRHVPNARGDVHSTSGNAKRAFDELGWSPRTELREGIQLQWESMNPGV